MRIDFSIGGDRPKQDIPKRDPLDRPPIPPKKAAKKVEIPPEIIENVVEPTKPLSMTEKIDELSDKMDILTQKKRLDKKKPFRLPFSVRSQLKQLAKQNKLLVFYLKENRSVVPLVCPMKDGMIQIGDKVHNVSMAFTYMWQNKYPCIVLPEWDLLPVGTKQYFDAVAANRTTNAQQIIIRNIKASEGGMLVKKLPGKTMVWIGIAVIVVLYVVFAGGG